jgi:hypothetical protein
MCQALSAFGQTLTAFTHPSHITHLKSNKLCCMTADSFNVHEYESVPSCRRVQQEHKKERNKAVLQLLRDGSIQLDSTETSFSNKCATAPAKRTTQKHTWAAEPDCQPDAANVAAWKQDASTVPQKVLQAAARHKAQKALRARGAPTFGEWLRGKTGHGRASSKLGKAQEDVSSLAGCAQKIGSICFLLS